MDNNQSLVPQYVLDQLSDEVCMKLNYFHRIYTPANMWEGVIDACEQIEQNPQAVNSVIVEAKRKHSTISVSGSNVAYYHMFLTRLYVLLYYRHPDDDVYKLVVFRRLEENMGIYRDKDILSAKIQVPIKIILEQKALLEKAQKTQKFGKPKFELYEMNENEVDGFMEEYLEENLFRSMQEPLKDYWNSHFGFRPNFIEVWYNAKDVVGKLWELRYPQSYIGYVMERYDKAIGHINTEYAQAVMCCVYCMMRTVTKSDHFAKAINAVEGYADANSQIYSLLASTVKRMKNIFDTESGKFVDYDYVGENQSSDMFTKGDVERIVGQYSSQLKDAQQTQAETQRKLEDALAEVKKHKAEQQAKGDDDNDDETDGKRFSCGQFVCLLYAAVLEIEGNEASPSKNSLKELFAKITGYSLGRIDKKLMGAFRKKKKKKVVEIIKDDLPKWANKVEKL